MENGKISSSFLIGLFVILSIGVLIGGIFWLGANEFFKPKKIYVTYFDGSIQGLEQGSPVKYLGVPVGNVSNITIAPNGILIEVEMKLDPKMNITADMRIKSEYSGIAGGKFLQIFKPEKGQNMPIISLDFKPPHPVIHSAPSGIDEIAIAAKQVVENLMQVEFGRISYELTELLTNFNTLLNNPNINKSLENVELATRNLSTFFDQLDTTRVVDNFINTSYYIANSADQLLLTVNDLRKKIEQVEVGSFLDKVYYDYDTTMKTVNHSIRKVSLRTDLLLLSLNSLIEDIRKTNQELRNALQTLQDDPSNIFLVRPPKKEE